MNEDRHQLLETLKQFLRNKKQKPSQLCQKFLNYLAEDSKSLIDILELVKEDEIDIFLTQVHQLEETFNFNFGSLRL